MRCVLTGFTTLWPWRWYIIASVGIYQTTAELYASATPPTSPVTRTTDISQRAIDRRNYYNVLQYFGSTVLKTVLVISYCERWVCSVSRTKIPSTCRHNCAIPYTEGWKVIENSTHNPAHNKVVFFIFYSTVQFHQ